VELQALVNQWAWTPQPFFNNFLQPTPDKDVRAEADRLIRNKGTLPPAVQQMVEGLLASPQNQTFSTFKGTLTSDQILGQVVDQYAPQDLGTLGAPKKDKPKKEPKDELGQDLLHAVAGQESGGDPTVINPDAASADEYGIGAIGRYQMLGSNVAAWSREAADAGKIPKSVADKLEKDPKAITGMPEIQDEIAAFKMEQYYQSAKDQGYSDDEAVRFVAAAWYSGDGNNLNSSAPQAGYPSIKQYTLEVLDKFKDEQRS
jgi:hypothetical protein